MHCKQVLRIYINICIDPCGICVYTIKSFVTVCCEIPEVN